MASAPDNPSELNPSEASPLEIDRQSTGGERADNGYGSGGYADSDDGPRSPKLSPWLLLVPVALVAGGFALWRFVFARGGPPMMMGGPQPVELSEVGARPVRDTSEFVGALEAIDRVTLRPQIDGRIVEILVPEGATVEAGTPIVQLRPERNRAEVSAARAQVNIQQAALNNARVEVRTATSEIERLQAEVSRQEAEVRSRQADVELGRTNYERIEVLVAEGAEAQQALDESVRERDSAIADLNAAEQSLNAARSALSTARNQFEAARARVEENRAALDQARANVGVVVEDLLFTRVAAPIAGTVGNIPVEVGDYVESGDVLTTITQNQQLDLRIAVPIERAEELQLGLPVELRLRPDGDPVAIGQIQFISPQVDQNAQALLVKARFPNPNGRLRDEQFARARIIWDENDSVVVPTSAVTRLGGQAFVFAAEPVAAAQDCQAGGPPGGPPQAPQPEDAIALWEEVDHVLAGLPQKTGLILAARLEGQSKSEIAEKLAVSRQTVHRICALLEQRLSERFDSI